MRGLEGTVFVYELMQHRWKEKKPGVNISVTFPRRPWEEVG